MLIELLVSLMILSITLLSVLPWFAIVDTLSERMDALVLKAANDYAVTLSREGTIVEIVGSSDPKGIWLDDSFFIPGDFEICFSRSGKLRYKDGYCIKGGTVRVGRQVFTVQPITAMVEKR